MAALQPTVQALQRSGWYLTQEGIGVCMEKTQGGVDDIVRAALDIDLKDIGEHHLPESLSKNKVEHVDGPFVLQIQKIRNISAPKDNEESQTAPKMFKLTLSDGHNNCAALELEDIPKLGVNTPPGAKVKLLGRALVSHGFLLLTPANCKVLGGNVDKLVENWQLKRTLAKQTRLQSGTDGGPPPFIPFGQRKQFLAQNKHSADGVAAVAVQNKHSENYKSLENKPDKKEDREFELQRQAGIDRALQAKDGNRKIFTSSNQKQVNDKDVAKIVEMGFSAEHATHVLRETGSVEEALNSLLNSQDSRQYGRRNDRTNHVTTQAGGGRGRGRDTREPRSDTHTDSGSSRRGRDERRSSDAGAGEENHSRPSAPATLFDFLTSKISTPQESKSGRAGSKEERDVPQSQSGAEESKESGEGRRSRNSSESESSSKRGPHNLPPRLIKQQQARDRHRNSSGGQLSPTEDRVESSTQQRGASQRGGEYVEQRSGKTDDKRPKQSQDVRSYLSGDHRGQRSDENRRSDPRHGDQGGVSRHRADGNNQRQRSGFAEGGNSGQGRGSQYDGRQDSRQRWGGRYHNNNGWDQNSAENSKSRYEHQNMNRGYDQKGGSARGNDRDYGPRGYRGQSEKDTDRRGDRSGHGNRSTTDAKGSSQSSHAAPARRQPLLPDPQPLLPDPQPLLPDPQPLLPHPNTGDDSGTWRSSRESEKRRGKPSGRLDMGQSSDRRTGQASDKSYASGTNVSSPEQPSGSSPSMAGGYTNQSKPGAEGGHQAAYSMDTGMMGMQSAGGPAQHTMASSQRQSKTYNIPVSIMQQFQGIQITGPPPSQPPIHTGPHPIQTGPPQIQAGSVQTAFSVSAGAATQPAYLTQAPSSQQTYLAVSESSVTQPTYIHSTPGATYVQCVSSQPQYVHQASGASHQTAYMQQGYPVLTRNIPQSTATYRDRGIQAPAKSVQAQVDSNPIQKQWKSGDCCMAKYYPENQFYRAVVQSTSASGHSCFVLFTDYGNMEEVAVADLRAMPLQAWQEAGSGSVRGGASIEVAQPNLMSAIPAAQTAALPGIMVQAPPPNLLISPAFTADQL